MSNLVTVYYSQTDKGKDTKFCGVYGERGV